MYWYRHLLPPISLYCTVQYNINTLCQYTVSGILPYEWLLCVVLVELSCVIHGWRGKWMWVIILCSSHNVWFIHHLLCVGFKSVYVVFKYHVTFVFDFSTISWMCRSVCRASDSRPEGYVSVQVWSRSFIVLCSWEQWLFNSLLYLCSLDIRSHCLTFRWSRYRPTCICIHNHGNSVSLKWHCSYTGMYWLQIMVLVLVLCLAQLSGGWRWMLCQCCWVQFCPFSLPRLIVSSFRQFA